MAAKTAKKAPSKKKSPKLTAAKRKKLSPKTFGLPGKKKYPLDTPNRARNALSRASKNASPAEKAQIRRAVKRKYPGIKVGGKKKAR